MGHFLSWLFGGVIGWWICWCVCWFSQPADMKD
jgi:hypothetical protein